MKEDKNQYIEDDKRLNKDDNNVDKYHAFSYADEKTNTPENNNHNNYESNDDYQSEGYRNERFQSVKIRKDQQDNKKNPNDRLLKRLNNIRKNYNSGQNIKKDLDDEEESNVQPKSNLSSSNMNQNNNGLNTKQNNNDNSINNNDFLKDNKLSNEDKLNKEQKQEETKPVNKSNGLENKKEEDKKESNDKNQGKTNSSKKESSISKTSPKTSVLNNIKSKALNKISAKSENAQKTGNAVEKVDRIQRVVAFISKYKYVLLIAGAILLFVLLFMLFLEIFASAAAVGNDEDEFSYSYYLNNFSQANFVLLDDSGNIIEENVNLKDLTIGVFYSYFGNQQLTEEQYKASLILIKTNILKNANFDSSDLTMNFNNYGKGKYCNPHVGCIEHMTEKGNVVAYSNLETLSIEGLTEAPTPAMNDSILTSLESAYDATEYLIVAKPDDSDFSQIPSSDYNGELINDEIANSIMSSSGTYNDIISNIASGYEVINAEETFKKYTSTVCSSGDWLWPIGSAECTIENGVKLCLGEPQVVNISANFGKYKTLPGKHYGIDISDGTKGRNVIASRGGTVYRAMDGYGDGALYNKDGYGYGNHVIIDHGDGYYSYYAHMLKGTVTVSNGDTVVAGQLIGQVGTSGNSDGVHLHFQITQGAANNNNAINPLKFVDPKNPRSSSCTSAVSGGSWDIFKSALSETEFISKMEAYCQSSGHKNFCNNFASKAKSVYETSEANNVNAELVVVTAGQEQGWNSHGTNNYWGINVTNGQSKIGTGYSSLEAGISAYAKFVNMYQDQNKWYYGAIVDINNQREKAGCKKEGHGMPNTLEGMQSLYSSIGTYRYNPGSSGLGGCYYLNIIYGSNYCNSVSTCSGSGNCPASSKTTICEQNDFTAYQVSEKLKSRKKIFGY